MKIDIKGFKGRLVKWILPLLINYLKQLANKMSENARKKLVSSVLEFEKECKKTSNKYDDVMVNMLKGLLNIK